MANNSGGPWGGDDGGDKGNNEPKTPWGKEAPQKPSSNENDIDRMIRDGQAQLKRIIGGGNGGGRKSGGSGDQPPSARPIFALLLLGGLAFWAYKSVHFIQATHNAVVMRFGKHVDTWGSGPHFAPWPIYNVEAVNVTEQQTEQIGRDLDENGQDSSLMLTSDENIIDIEFEVVWRIKNLPDYQFNLAGQRDTIHAVAQSSIREVVARSPLIPLLSTKRDETMIEVKSLIQSNLDAYDSGIEIVRVNLTKSDAPKEVIKDFEDVQAAEQERDTKQSDAQKTANRVLADARGEEAQLMENAEAYRSEKINDAEGEASRFTAVLEEYKRAPEVTRRRIYLETMQDVYGQMNKIIIDGQAGEGVVPYLPLNELNKGASQ